MGRSKTVIQIIPKLTSLLLIILFTYAAFTKLLDFDNFQIQLGQSPLTNVFAKALSVSIPLLELMIVLALCFRALRFWGLFAGYILMLLFSGYIFIILNYSSYVPCSCGGILEKLGWTEHLVFNVLVTLLACSALLISNKQTLLTTPYNHHED